MNDQEKPALHALSLEPRTARPGEIVSLCFRTPNVGATASPPATVRFVLPPELEALDEAAQRIEPVPPGADVVATCRARLAGPLKDGTQLGVSALLDLEHEVLSSNRCALRVRSTPVLDGPRSGVFLELQDDRTIVVRAVVCNEGDGPACDVALHVSPPLGCSPLDGEPTALTVPRLDVGERTELRFAARLVAPGETIVVDDALLRCGDGVPITLPVRDRITLAPVLTRPEVCMEAQRRAVQIRVGVRNEGWADAHEVPLRIVLPPPLRPLEGSVEVDGVPVARRAGAAAFARVERSGPATTIVLARVPARSGAQVTLSAALPARFTPGMVEIEFAGHQVPQELAAPVICDLRLRAVASAPTVEPGEAAAIGLEVINAGDRAETLTLTASGADLADEAAAAELSITAGAIARLALAPRVRADLRDGAQVPIVLRAQAGGEERARATCTIVVRDRARIVVLDPPQISGAQIAYTLHNAGSTRARDVRAMFAQTAYEIGALAASASMTLLVAEADARCGGRVWVAGREVLTVPAFATRNRSAVCVALEGPPDVLAGAAFVVRARVAIPDGAERLTLRAPLVAGAVYVAGSTVLDGVALLDRADGSPLCAPGLVLHDVPQHTELSLAWSLLTGAAPEEALVMPQLVVAREDEQDVAETLAVGVRARPLFTARPATFAYHLDACALAPPISQTPVEPQAERTATVLPLEVLLSERRFVLQRPQAEPDGDEFWFELRLDDARVMRTLRAGDGTLAAHLVALRGLLPDHETSGDRLVAAALGALRAAVGELYDRLFVKLRIPGFTASAADLEDRDVRGALTRLFERLLEVRPGGEAYVGPAVRLSRARVRMLLAEFEGAELGVPAALRALGALLPNAGDDDALLCAALGRYGNALDAALAACEGLGADAYDAALSVGRAELDDARAAVLAALRARSVIAGVA